VFVKLENRDALELVGRPAPWSRRAVWAIFFLVLAGFVLRAVNLSAEGFSDDEVHKWLAANRYLIGDFGGDDVEHPMLMKWLIVLALVIGKPLGWAPETMVRLPNVFVGAISIAVVAMLGRRLFGERAALIGAALAAFSPTWIGYQRAAKEDTLLCLFLMTLLWCAAEAKAAADDRRDRDRARWEWLGAASVGAMFASKYFFFLAPIPVLLYLWLRGTKTAWRMPLSRWLILCLGSILVFAALNFTPFVPSNWDYGLSYMAEKKTIHGSLFFMGALYHNLPSWFLKGTPPWFYVVFAAVKLGPPTFVLAVAGIGLALKERRPSHRVLLSWLIVWFLIFSISGSKWGRFFISILPAFALFAGHAADRAMAYAIRSWRNGSMRAATAAFGIAIVGVEAYAAVTHAPHYRLYINALGGGDENAGWFFPHCDYYDAGFREAMRTIAERAEPNAEVASEIDWVSAYYAERFDRPDLKLTMMRRGEACTQGRVCYVIVQSGRRYYLNVDALDHLEQKTPWYAERIRGLDVVRVYRLEPPETPFPNDLEVVEAP
jgi:4-amino-4-deoxy-L-arabinose transferase-like glycosyltransferase